MNVGTLTGISKPLGTIHGPILKRLRILRLDASLVIALCCSRIAATGSVLTLWFQFHQNQAIVDGRAQFGPPGYECDLLYIACIAALVFLNPGLRSIDGYRLRKRNA